MTDSTAEADRAAIAEKAAHLRGRYEDCPTSLGFIASNLVWSVEFALSDKWPDGLPQWDSRVRPPELHTFQSALSQAEAVLDGCARIAELEAQIASITSERPYIVGWNHGFAEAEYQAEHGRPSEGDCPAQYQYTAAEYQALEARVRELEGALQPFGFVDAEYDDIDDNMRVVLQVTANSEVIKEIGMIHLRDASRILNKEKADEH